MAEAQTKSEEIHSYRTAISKLKLIDIPVSNNGPTRLCDISTGKPRPIVPCGYRKHVFEVIHNLSHPGITTTKKRISNKFVWHNALNAKLQRSKHMSIRHSILSMYLQNGSVTFILI